MDRAGACSPHGCAASPARRAGVAAAIAAAVVLFAAAPVLAQGVPFIYQPLSPTCAAPGSSAFTLRINGTGFVSGAAVDWNGQPLPTTFISTSRLAAAIPPADVATAQTVTITVHNPGVAPASNSLYFLVADPIARMDYTNAPGSPIWLGHNGNYLNQPYSLAVGNFERPGQDDIVLGMMDPGNDGALGAPPFLDLYANQGGGAFALQSSTPGLGSAPSSIAVGDFTGNGRLDVATANDHGTVTVLLNNGNGTFSPSQTLSLPDPGSLVLQIVTADFNHDGRLDLAVAADGGIYVFLGNGDGTFSPAPGSPVDAGPNADFFGLAVGDFNDDGNLDLAAGGYADGGVYILLGKGDGTFVGAGGAPISLSPGVPTGIAAADFNGDGKLDIAAVANNPMRLDVLLGRGDGTFTPVAEPVPDMPWQDGIFGSIYGWALQAGYFLADGRLDIAAMEQDEQGSEPEDFIYTYLGNGDGTFTPSDYSVLLPQSPQGNFAEGGFVSNGLLDFATASDLQNWLNILLPSPTPGPPPDFSLVARSDASATVAQAAAATYKLGVASLNGFTGPVYLTCSAGVPANATCSWNAPDAPLATGINTAVGAGFVTALPSGYGPGFLPAVTIQTTAPSLVSPSAAAPPDGSGRVGAGFRRAGVGWWALLFLISCAGCAFAAPRIHRHVFALALPALVALLAAASLSSCGSQPATAAQRPPVYVGGTPAGTYTVTITCTAYRGSPLAFSHTLPLTLTVTAPADPAAATAAPGRN